MRTLLIVLMIISGLILTISVLLMSPKGGLGMGIGGVAGNWEYGSRKSIENTLQKIAIVASIIFVISVLFLPYTTK